MTKKNLKKRKFEEAARITSHNKEQLVNKKDERKTISNLWKIVSNNKTSWNLNVMRELNYHFKKLVIYITKKKSIFSSLNDDLTKIDKLVFIKGFITLIFNILIKINY